MVLCFVTAETDREQLQGCYGIMLQLKKIENMFCCTSRLLWYYVTAEKDREQR